MNLMERIELDSAKREILILKKYIRGVRAPKKEKEQLGVWSNVPRSEVKAMETVYEPAELHEMTGISEKVIENLIMEHKIGAAIEMDFEQFMLLATVSEVRKYFKIKIDLPAAWKKAAKLWRLEAENIEEKVEKRLLDAPELRDFYKGILLESQHQDRRWGPDHDKGKSPEDWLWLVAFLATKATQAARYGDWDKYLHHIVTTAAALYNWHKRALRMTGDKAKAVRNALG